MRRTHLFYFLALLSMGCAPSDGSDEANRAGRSVLEQAADAAGGMLGGPALSVLRGTVLGPHAPTPAPLGTSPYSSPASPEPSGGPASTVVQEPAAALASQVLAGGEETLLALRTALVMSGLPVLDDDGRPLVVAGHTGTGLPLAGWEVRLLAANARSAAGMRLADLGYVLEALPGLAGQPIAEMLMEGIRDAANSREPDSHFWSLFIAELGRQRAEPVDLLAAASPDEVMLDGLQIQLILRRLTADLALAGSSNRADAGMLSWLISCRGRAQAAGRADRRVDLWRRVYCPTPAARSRACGSGSSNLLVTRRRYSPAAQRHKWVGSQKDFQDTPDHDRRHRFIVSHKNN
jgi:hypothetical protein